MSHCNFIPDRALKHIHLCTPRFAFLILNDLNQRTEFKKRGFVVNGWVVDGPVQSVWTNAILRK